MDLNQVGSKSKCWLRYLPVGLRTAKRNLQARLDPLRSRDRITAFSIVHSLISKLRIETEMEIEIETKLEVLSED